MSDGAGGHSNPAEAAGNLPASQLPWQQIPVFDAQTTDLQVYSRKLQFLRDIWPQEHISQLAPRAALLVQGVAFQKVARLDATKLRSEAGVKYLVEALGGQWGKLATEEKLALFEKALYLTAQKGDESNDSYLARHDLAFEDLISKGITLEEVRAYVLIRQSQLPAEDRKRIVVESQGDLTYEQARKSLRLLGSRFFQDLQGGSKTGKFRTYDTNVIDSPEEPTMVATDMELFDEEAAFQALFDAGDEDAAFIADFEETIVETVQESPELASCYHTYLEARTRLRERAKFRGFWGVPNLGKGKGKKSKGAGGKRPFVNRGKTLAEKIASSACRRCGQTGHWKRECPLGAGKGDSKGKNLQGETITLAEALMACPSGHQEGDDDETELMNQIPENAENIGQKKGTRMMIEETMFGEEISERQDPGNSTMKSVHQINHPCTNYQNFQVFNSSSQNFETPDNDPSNSFQSAVTSLVNKDFKFTKPLKQLFQSGFKEKLPNRLIQCCRKHGHCKQFDTTAVTSSSDHRDSDGRAQPTSNAVEVFILNEERAGEAVIDTGASRSVIGEDRVDSLVQVLTEKGWGPVKRIPSKVQFRFGNSGALQSSFALCIPRQQKGWLRVEVVPGQTPFSFIQHYSQGTRCFD